MGEKEPENEILKRVNRELIVAGYSKRTRESYTQHIRDFLKFVKMRPEDVEREDIITYIVELKEERNAANNTIALVLASLRFLFRNILKRSVVDDIKSPKKGKKLPTVLTKEEVKSLIKAGKIGRDKLIIGFLYSSGCRVSELVSMKLIDLNLKERIAKVRGGKGDKDRIIVLSQKWISDLKRDLKRKKIASEYIFSKKNGKPLSVDTIQRTIRICAKKAEIPKKVTPHSLRHSFATHLLDNGENIRKIQELLGHSNLNTTQIYTRVSVEGLKKVKSPLDNL